MVVRPWDSAKEVAFYLNTYGAILVPRSSPVWHHHRVEPHSTSDHDQNILRALKRLISAVWVIHESLTKFACVANVLRIWELGKLPQPLLKK